MRKRSDILVSLYVALIAFIVAVGFIRDAKTLVSNEYDIVSNIKVLTESDDNNADMKVVETDHIRIV